VAGLSTTVTSYSLAPEIAWPNVTVKLFDVRVSQVLDPTGIDIITFSPIVTNPQRLQWESYSFEHQSWIDSDIKATGNTITTPPGEIHPTIFPYYQAIDTFDLSGTFINGSGTKAKATATKARQLKTVIGQEFFVPLWQTGPIPRNASIINLDLFTHPAFTEMIRDVLKANKQLLSGVQDLNLILDYIMQDFVNSGEPRSFALQPVFNDFTTNATVAGFLMADVAWRKFFTDVLADGVNGFVIEMHETCGKYEKKRISCSLCILTYAAFCLLQVTSSLTRSTAKFPPLSARTRCMTPGMTIW
jgi:hypothetical protein